MIPRDGKRARAEMGARTPVMARAERVSAKATGTRGVSDNPAKMDVRRCAFVRVEHSELELSPGCRVAERWPDVAGCMCSPAS